MITFFDNHPTVANIVCALGFLLMATLVGIHESGCDQSTETPCPNLQCQDVVDLMPISDGSGGIILVPMSVKKCICVRNGDSGKD